MCRNGNAVGRYGHAVAAYPLWKADHGMRHPRKGKRHAEYGQRQAAELIESATPDSKTPLKFGSKDAFFKVNWRKQTVGIATHQEPPSAQPSQDRRYG